MSTKCRAKNPGSCRVHGSTNAVSVLMNDRIALHNVQNSQKALDNAGNMEEYFEAQQSLSHDKRAYDATLKGEEDIRRDLMGLNGTLNADEKLDRKMRLAEAKSYRAETLLKDPAHQETVATYENFTKENAVSKHSFEKGSLKSSLNALRDIPYGTPVAIKLKHGVIYAHSGDGFGERPKNKFSAKVRGLLVGKPSFVRDGENPDMNENATYRTAHLAVKSSGNLLPVREVEEVTVLKPDAYKNGFDGLVNSHADKTPTNEAAHQDNSRWSVKTADSYQEFEGYNDIRNAGWETTKKDWTVGSSSYGIKDALEVREIKS